MIDKTPPLGWLIKTPPLVFLADTEADKGTLWQGGHSGALRLSRPPHFLQSQAVPLAHEGESLSFPAVFSSCFLQKGSRHAAVPLLGRCLSWPHLAPTGSSSVSERLLSGAGSLKSSESSLHRLCRRLGKPGKA